MGTKHSLPKNMMWRLTLDFFSRGLFFIINILIARALGVSDFGKFAYAVSLAQIFYIFTDMGTLIQLVKELGESRGRNEIRWKYFLEVKLILMAGCLLVFSIVGPLMWRWDQRWVPYLALLWMFSNSMLDFNQYVCNGLGRLDLARGTLVIQRAFTLSALGFVALFYRTLPGILIGLSVGGVAGCVASNLYFFKKTGVSLSFSRNYPEWGRILKVSFPNGISNAFGSWYLRLASLFLGWMATSVILGEYTGAFRLFEMTYIIPAALMSVSVPHLAEALQRGRDAYKKELWYLGRLMIPVGVAFGLVLSWQSDFIVRLVLGSDFTGAGPVLHRLGWVAILVFLNYYVTHLMVVVNAQKRHALHQFLVFLCSLAFHIVAIDRAGSLGAASALLATELTLFALTTIYLVRWHNAPEGKLSCA